MNRLESDSKEDVFDFRAVAYEGAAWDLHMMQAELDSRGIARVSYSALPPHVALQLLRGMEAALGLDPGLHQVL